MKIFKLIFPVFFVALVAGCGESILGNGGIIDNSSNDDTSAISPVPVPGTNAVYVASQEHGLYKLENDRITFKQIPNTSTDTVWKALIQTKDGSILASAGVRGIKKSIDKGTTWVDTSNNGNALAFLMLKNGDILAAFDDSTFLGQTNSGFPIIKPGGSVWKSSDNGTTWDKMQQASNNIVWKSLVLLPDSGRVLGGTSKGIYISDDEGITWKPTSVATSVTSILHIPGTKTIIANSIDNIYEPSSNKIQRSDDNGDSWTAINANDVTWLAFSSLPDGSLLGATAGKGVHRSTDDGKSWQPTTLSTGYWTSFPELADNKNNIFVFGSEDRTIASHGIYTSSNNGATWSKVGNSISDQVNAVLAAVE